jgi:phosphoenolpyruvate carboxykinase (ATP)
MNQTGPFNPTYGAEKFGLKDLTSISYNLDAAPLAEDAIKRGEAVVAKGGALNAETGIHTGRSPNDKFVVRDDFTEKAILWDNNKAMTQQAFDQLYSDMLAHAKGKDLYAQDLYGGADPEHRIKVRVFTEFAWHSLFIRDLLIRPPVEDLISFVPDLTRICLHSAPIRRATVAGRRPSSRSISAARSFSSAHELCGRNEEVGLYLPQLFASD